VAGGGPSLARLIANSFAGIRSNAFCSERPSSNNLSATTSIVLACGLQAIENGLRAATTDRPGLVDIGSEATRGTCAFQRISAQIEVSVPPWQNNAHNR